LLEAGWVLPHLSAFEKQPEQKGACHDHHKNGPA
jgi:hypothetical protein